jgi:LPXTG-site transpeptidase (sortase) family protein
MIKHPGASARVRLVFSGDGNVFKKVNWLVLLGSVIILLGVANFWYSYQKSAPTVFDMVDGGTGGDQFIPLLVPVTSTGMGATAPTLSPVVSNSEQVQPVIGLIPDRLVIPSIYLDAPIVPVHYKDIDSGGQVYHQWRVPAEFAVGWQDESALLGLPGNTVLNGHHNAHGMVFKNLVQLKVGDLISVYSGGTEYRYVVAAKMLLPERGETLETRMENARWIQASTDERLTLVTCWPANSNTHRVIIVALPEGTPIQEPSASGMGN